ncbi:MAG: signal peptidase II [Ruminococcaceae bacterium]|nr:signal peptidase II [Oscillospiraceae bacterium]
MSALLAIICGVLVVVVDQLTKYLVTVFMDVNEVIKLIPGILNLNRITPNAGAAFGILEGKTWFLITVTALIMIICIGLLIRKTFDSKLMYWALCLVLGGGIGNLIDRVARGGNVIDFLEFGFFEFPVFNVADIAVCVGAGMMVLYFIVDFIADWRRRAELANVDFAVSDEERQSEPADKEEQ